MFKYSREGVSVLTILDTRRKKNNGLFPIKIQVVYRRKQKYYPTGKDISVEEWGTLLKARSCRLVEIRIDVESSFSNLKKQVRDLLQKGEFSFRLLNAKLDKPSEITTLNVAFQNKMKELQENEQAGTYLNYRSTLRNIECFAGTKIPLEAITIDWLNRCEKYWLSTGKKYSSISIYFRALKCVLNRAVKEGVLKENHYPFGKGKYEIPEGCGRKLALTLSEIKRVISYTDGTKELEEFRDLWFFSYLCNGINFMDLLYLQYSNIVNGEICFIRSKTSRTTKHSREIRAVLTVEMQNIIERWGNSNTGPDTYIFKYVKGTENAFEKIRLVRSIIAKCNRRLKKIADETGIGKLTTYTARHSFATVLKRSGAKTSYISESLGHSNLKVTENYLAYFEKEERIKNSKFLTNF